MLGLLLKSDGGAMAAWSYGETHGFPLDWDGPVTKVVQLRGLKSEISATYKGENQESTEIDAQERAGPRALKFRLFRPPKIAIVGSTLWAA
jgi:hypothetical protein